MSLRRSRRDLPWVAALAFCLAWTAPGYGQLTVNSTSGPVTASLDFRGTVNYILSPVGGPDGPFAAHNFSVAQAGLTAGSVTFNYPNGAAFDYTLGAEGSGFRPNLLYTNNTGTALRGLRFDYTGSPGEFQTFSSRSIPTRGTLTSPAGPNPTFTGTASGLTPNGDTISFSPASIDWTFATPLGDTSSYAFFEPIGALSPGGGSFTVSFTPTPVPEPSACLALAACGVGAYRLTRRRRRGSVCYRSSSRRQSTAIYADILWG